MTAHMPRRLSTLALAAALGALFLAPAVPASAQHAHHGASHDGADAKAADLSATDPSATAPNVADPHAAHRAMMAAPADSAVGEPVAGLTIPDVAVRTQDGEARHFYSDLVAGRVVAMNFVFTTCTTICPPMGANFGRLQKELGERLGREVFLISVSVDPTTDTPQRLKAWGEKFGARDGWTLVTGEQQEMERLLKSLQVFNADIREHSPVVLIGNDAEGRWTRAYGLAGPHDLAAIVDRVSASTGDAGAAHHDGHHGAHAMAAEAPGGTR